MTMFLDREDAGRRLATALAGYKSKRPVILALPRGGIPVAAEIAAALDAPLDLILVRKVGVPSQPELAMGAVVDGSRPIFIQNEDVIRLAGVSASEYRKRCEAELAEIERRRARYLQGRQPVELAGRVVIVVDDGIATGATASAALTALRNLGPRELVLAVPVASPEAISQLRRGVDHLVCLATPERFAAIGYFYKDFRQVSDDEVMAILARFPATKRQAAAGS